MDLRRLSAGDWIVGVSGLALLVSLFVPWHTEAWLYQESGGAWTKYGPIAEGGISGWEALGAIDLLLALVAATAVLLPLVTATQQVPAVPIALAAVVTLVGLVGVVLVLLRVADVPDDLAGREWGLWLALASSIGIVAGGCVAMRAEHWPSKAEDVKTMPAPQP